jgi:hypothetical protein
MQQHQQQTLRLDNGTRVAIDGDAITTTLINNRVIRGARKPALHPDELRLAAQFADDVAGHEWCRCIQNSDRFRLDNWAGGYLTFDHAKRTYELVNFGSGRFISDFRRGSYEKLCEGTAD